MIPGLGGDPRQMAMMMRQLGIEVKDLPGVTKIVIETTDGNYVFDQATVSIMKARGVETWQVSGVPKKVEAKNAPAAKSEPKVLTPAADAVVLEFTDEDVEMVAEQALVPTEKAREALIAAKGDVAEAIVALLGDE